MARVVLLAAACCLATAAFMLLSVQPCARAALIVHKANSTACYTCDLDVDFSGRNFMCCLVHSRCCGPEKLERKRRSWL
ncbi:unnamed protein product [Ixodes pacificus]|uniref:Secreted protein n=1 Tax=Ixodes scapularis TaxID=6945 RepID=B7PYR9_IXOSC|nr:hypothetical protein IscW_ISCW020080 [Ixodes scapularis]|eukprot:XP_002403758.1 hypothetical protein IscW_ISCW020080 [Ixodes scapularis]